MTNINYKDLIILEIYNRYSRGEITTEERNLLFDKCDEVFNESDINKLSFHQRIINNIKKYNDNKKRLSDSTRNYIYKLDFVEKVKECSKLFDITWDSGSTDTQIRYAENRLGIKFPKEYILYLKEFGQLHFHKNSICWTSVNLNDPYNVIKLTDIERKRNKYFPKDCFILEGEYISSSEIFNYTAMDERGNIYIYDLNINRWVPHSGYWLPDYFEEITFELYEMDENIQKIYK